MTISFEAATLTHLENILSDAFLYHNQLDSFVLRSGVDNKILKQSRDNANKRVNDSPRGYSKAPKRFVVQELINLLQRLGNEGNKMLSALITQVISPSFSATPLNQEVMRSIQTIKLQIENDKQQKKNSEAEKEAFRKHQEQERKKQEENIYLQNQNKRERFRTQFIELTNLQNPQERGFAFEKFLSSYFEFENLEPKNSFKITGEQIDGSFIFQNNTHLLEAKWTKEHCSGAEFGAFMFKLEGKSADTRGLFISINGYSQDAIKALNSKGRLHFICIDGTHLFRSLESAQTLKNQLQKLWRHASETGNAYLPASQMTSI